MERTGRRTAALATSLAIVVGAAAGGMALLGRPDANHAGARHGTVRAAQPPLKRGLLSLPAAAQAPISAALGRDERSYRVRALPDREFAAANPAQRLRATFTAAGASITAGDARLALALRGYGVANALTPAPRAAPELRAGRIVYDRGPIEEWFANGPLGIEQGFTVGAPLEQAPSSAPLTLSIATGDGMRASIDHGQVMLHGGGASLRYTDLTVTDARGRPLRAWLALRQDRLLIHVNTVGARYPVRIDPLVDEGELTATTTGNAPLGNAVAVSGGTVVVGATEAAYVFTKPAGGWGDATQTAALSATEVNGLAPQGFGDSVAVSGDTIVVGAPSSAIVAKKSDVGAAYVFTMPNGGWASQPAETQTATLTGAAADTRANDQFGVSVAIDGDTVALGAPSTADAGGDYGAVFEYTMPNGGWASAPSETQTALLTGVGNVGSSVAVSGNTIVAGAPFNSNEDIFAGAADLFTMPNGGWATAPTETESAALYGSDIAAGDHYGASIAISGDGSTVAVGAPDHTVGANADQGAAYVFVKPAGGWPVTKQQDAELTATGGQANDQLGSAVALDGTTVYAGAPSADGGEGGAYEYDMPAAGWSSAPNETQTAELTPSGAGYAFATALASDGTTLAAGAPGANGGNGAAFVYGQAAPTSVAFTISPYNDPTLAGRTLTFSITNPAAGVTYAWDFGNGHTATGTTVTYAYPAATAHRPGRQQPLRLPAGPEPLPVADNARGRLRRHRRGRGLGQRQRVQHKEHRRRPGPAAGRQLHDPAQLQDGRDRRLDRGHEPDHDRAAGRARGDRLDGAGPDRQGGVLVQRLAAPGPARHDLPPGRVLHPHPRRAGPRHGPDREPRAAQVRRSGAVHPDRRVRVVLAELLERRPGRDRLEDERLRVEP